MTTTTMTPEQLAKYPRLAARQRRTVGGGGNVRPDANKPSIPKASNIGNVAFDKGVNYFLDDARLNPDNDPYMKRWLDIYAKQSQDAFDRSTYDLHNKLAGGGMLGTGYYQGQLIGATDQYNQDYEQNLVKYLQDTRTMATQDRLKALGLISDRDIAAANNKAQVSSARISAAPGLAAVRLDRDRWTANQPWDDIKNMIDINNGLNQLGGYTMSGSYIPQTYSGASPWASGIMTGIGTGLAAYGVFNKG